MEELQRNTFTVWPNSRKLGIMYASTCCPLVILIRMSSSSCIHEQKQFRSHAVSEALTCIKSVLKTTPRVDAKDMVGIYHEMSIEKDHGPRWNTLSKQKAAQELAHLTTARIESLDADVFKHVSENVLIYHLL